MDYNYAVFIGRFQPLHNAHLDVIRQSLKIAKNLIIAIGSARSARNTKNPWTYDERVTMIRSCLTGIENSRVHFIPARDYHYNDNHWMTEVQQRIHDITNGDPAICLIGSYKDSSSYYIKFFPQWEFIPAKTVKTMDATDVRTEMFCIPSVKTWGDKGSVASIEKEDLDIFQKWLPEYVPAPIGQCILEWMQKPEYVDLKEEFEYIQEYKRQWSNVPFPVTFNTVDTVVIQSGHILVVKRKYNPGKGLFALPGGFLKQNERLEAAAIRELKEETGIKVHVPVLSSHVVDSKTFDYPARSLRGRTITTAFYIRLPDGELPDVKGSDDADKAIWMPLMDVMAMENQFFEDHAHIIRYFLGRG